MSKIDPQPGILDIEPYVAGKSSVAGSGNIVKLSANENPFGPSPAAQEAVQRTLHELNRYPPTDHSALRRAIGEVHGLDPARIICGAGSDELLHLVCQAYAGPGDRVLFTEHGFGIYRIVALAAGATPVAVPERERVTDVDAILDACDESTKLVFIANPNNPTGTMIGLAEVERLADGLPERALLVLDGAYAEFVEGYDGGARIVDSRENVVMTRTFSKIYGLGGMRVGWGYGTAAVVDVLNRIRGPFNLSVPALAAAEAAVRDIAYVEKCRAENTRLRAWLSDALAEHGVPCDSATANFVLARFGSAEEAEACDLYLQKQGLIVRRVASYNLPHALRITVGDEPACRQVAHHVGLFKAGAR